MRRVVMTALFALAVVRAAGQFVVNNDPLTFQAMILGYGANNLAESELSTQLDDVLHHYGLSAKSSSVIFGSALAERKGRTDLTGWNGAEENYYYKRIYSLVRDGIIPKTLSVALLCVKDPAQVFYWGRFLLEVCSDTKNLCAEFESVVTNSRLSFRDLPFLELNTDVLPFCSQDSEYFGFLKPSLDQLASRISGITKEDLKASFADLGGMTDVLKSGVAGLTDVIRQDMEKTVADMAGDVYGLRERFSVLLYKDNDASAEMRLVRSQYMDVQQRMRQLTTAMDHGTGGDALMEEYESLSSVLQTLQSRLTVLDRQYKTLQASVGGSSGIVEEAAARMTGLVSTLSPQDVVTWILRTASYDLSRWVSDYIPVIPGQYYTQMWRVQAERSGDTTLVNYYPPVPPVGSNASHWLASGEELPGAPTSDYNNELNNWTDALALSLNLSGAAPYLSSPTEYTDLSGTSHTVSVEYARRRFPYPTSATIPIDGCSYTLNRIYHAYSVTVTDRYRILKIADERLFDSATDSEEALEEMMTGLVDAYNVNTDRLVYRLVKDAPHYYPAADSAKLVLTDEAVVSAVCSERYDFDQGSTAYKCDEDSHGDCALLDHAETFGDEGTELYAYISRLEDAIPRLRQTISDLRSEEAQLQLLLGAASPSQARSYRQRLSEIRSELSVLTQELADAESQLAECRAAVDELENDDDVGDNSYRIPAIQRDVAQKHGLKWLDTGSLDRSTMTWTRHATMEGQDAVLTFECSIRESSPRKFLLGFIRIHRARIVLSWKLYADIVTTSVVSTTDLRQTPEEERKSRVDEAVRAAQRQYPSCEITLDYVKTDSVDTADTEDTYHLLWASDRLEAARRIESRLTKLYASLVNLERMLGYKMSIVSLLTTGQHFDTNVGRQRTNLQRIRDRWGGIADSVGVTVSLPSSSQQDK